MESAALAILRDLGFFALRGKSLAGGLVSHLVNPISTDLGGFSIEVHFTFYRLAALTDSPVEKHVGREFRGNSCARAGGRNHATLIITSQSPTEAANQSLCSLYHKHIPLLRCSFLRGNFVGKSGQIVASHGTYHCRRKDSAVAYNGFDCLHPLGLPDTPGLSSVSLLSTRHSRAVSQRRLTPVVSRAPKIKEYQFHEKLSDRSNRKYAESVVTVQVWKERHTKPIVDPRPCGWDLPLRRMDENVLAVLAVQQDCGQVKMVLKVRWQRPSEE